MRYASSEGTLKRKESNNSLCSNKKNSTTPKYTPVYVIAGFLDSGKTTLINKILNQNNQKHINSCVIQFEDGEQTLNIEHSGNEGFCDTLKYSVRHIENKNGIMEVSSKIYDYLVDNEPQQIWIEWNGILPISVLQEILYGYDNDKIGTPGEFCKINKVVFVADDDSVQPLLAQTGSAVAEQISNSDIVVIRNAQTKKEFNYLKHSFKSLNSGISVFPQKCITKISNDIIKNKMNQFETLFFYAVYLLTGYFILRYLIGTTSVDLYNSMFLGIILQALPFLMIGILLSSAIQVFVPKKFIEKHFPKNIFLGILFTSLCGFFLPVCDCASVPVFKSLIKKGVPLPSAIAFMMATPVINPVVILSTWYAFGGNAKIVLSRILLGLFCSVLIGLSFMGIDSRKIMNSKFISVGGSSSGCCGGLQNESNGKVIAFLKHAQSEFFTVGKYLVIGSLISVAIQMVSKNFNWSTDSTGLFIPLLVMIAMAFFLSLCSSSDAVVAKSFSTQFPMGAIMGFLVFGPMMDIKNLIMLSGSFTKKFVLRLVITTFIVCTTVVFLAFSLGLEGIL